MSIRRGPNNQRALTDAPSFGEPRPRHAVVADDPRVRSLAIVTGAVIAFRDRGNDLEVPRGNKRQLAKVLLLCGILRLKHGTIWLCPSSARNGGPMSTADPSDVTTNRSS